MIPWLVETQTYQNSKSDKTTIKLSECLCQKVTCLFPEKEKNLTKQPSVRLDGTWRVYRRY